MPTTKPMLPRELKLLEGRSPGRDSGGRKVSESHLDRATPTMPRTLSHEAKREWQKIVPGLARQGILKKEDGSALAVYCENYSEWVAANKAINEHYTKTGKLTYTAAQGEIPIPEIAIRRRASAEIRSFAGHFGLTPSTETALFAKRGETLEADEENPFAGTA